MPRPSRRAGHQKESLSIGAKGHDRGKAVFLKLEPVYEEVDSDWVTLTHANVAPAFIHNTSGYKRIYNIFHNDIKIIHGKKAIKFIRGRPVYLQLEPVYEEGHSDCVTPWKSEVTESLLIKLLGSRSWLSLEPYDQKYSLPILTSG